MQVGDVIEIAVWLDGKETSAQRKQFEIDMQSAIREKQMEFGLVFGPLHYIEKKLGEDRVPPVPDHISGPNVRLLVAEVQVTAILSQIYSGSNFINDLEPEDLALLRRITRRKYAEHHPKSNLISDDQCDSIINELGPEAALDTLRGANKNDLV